MHEVESVGDVLKETLDRPITPGNGDRVHVGAVFVAPTSAARTTARSIQRGLLPGVGLNEKDWLCPTVAWTDPERGIRCFADIVANVREKVLRDGNALVVVGHAPQLDWFAHEVLKRPYALAHAEIVCIASRRGGWLSRRWRRGWIPWAVSPRDDATRDALLKKIQSKMEIAKLFSVVLAFALGVILDQDKIRKATGLDTADMVLGDVATLLFLVGFALYLATLYAYDQLLMPTRFWTQGRKRAWRAGRWLPRRPPSSSTLVLYQK